MSDEYGLSNKTIFKDVPTIESKRTMNYNSIISFQAHVKWAKVFERNRDLGDDTTDAGMKIRSMEGQYSVEAYPVDVDKLTEWLNKAQVNMSPMGHDLLKENDGKVFIKPKRWHKCPLNAKGEVIPIGGPPAVVTMDGDKWDPDMNIGNGSLCDVAIEVWKPKTAKKYFVRLKAIRVLDLVEHTDAPTYGEADWVVG